MEFQRIPVKVIEDCILPHLEWNDLLRLRRVCKWTKDMTDGYLKGHAEMAPEMEINEGKKSFAAFMKLGIPTTKIFINNRSGCDFYRENSKDMVKFLKRFGPYVKSLRVDQITGVPFGKELDFLEGLKNLESLEAGQFGGYRRERGLDDIERVVRECLQSRDPRLRIGGSQNMNRFPTDFLKRVKTLKIGNNDDGDSVDHFSYNQSLSVGGIALTSVTLPFHPQAKPIQPTKYYNLMNQPLAATFALLVDCVLWRRKGDEDPSCQEIDFQNFHDFGEPEMQFYRELPSSASRFFALYMKLKNMKLMNVGSSWFMGIEGIPIDIFNNEQFEMPIWSMINIHPCTFRLNMSNLERVEVKSTARSSPGNNWKNERPDWPALKSLAINVDSKTGECPDTPATPKATLIFHRTSTKELFGFFFENVSRTAITELHLEFVGVAGNVTIPKAESIVSACPNLKKLSLVKWPGLNKALIKLWGGLPGLEEISLEYCEPLGNVAFVGEDVRAPIFLKLSRMRKLTLKGLDKMPKITDLLFTLVIRHLKLTHLILTSDVPIKSITAAGIRSLLDGDFAGSIEKFPFRNWSLEGVSVEEFKKLQKEFRSSNML